MITFGGYDTNEFAKEPLEWYPNYTIYIDHYFWAVYLSGARIGDRELKRFNRMAVVDSGSSYILMPNDVFQDFRDDLSKIAENWMDEWGQVYVECHGDLYD